MNIGILTERIKSLRASGMDDQTIADKLFVENYDASDIAAAFDELDTYKLPVTGQKIKVTPKTKKAGLWVLVLGLGTVAYFWYK